MTTHDYSEIAREVARKVVDSWYSGNFVAIGAECKSDLTDRIAVALQSHADAARLAERERIRDAVEKERHGKALHQEWSQVHHDTIDRILAAIDSQPVKK